MVLFTAFCKEMSSVFEVESFFDCSYAKGISSLYKKMMCTHGRSFKVKECAFYQYDQEFNNTFELVVDEGAGIGKVFDAVTEYCGFHINESGKTMAEEQVHSPAPKMQEKAVAPTRGISS